MKGWLEIMEEARTTESDTTLDLGRWDGVRRIWEIIDRLRGEGGCPWDRKQTPHSVQTYLVEEAHEAAAAIRADRKEEAAEELGDLLFMVLFLVHLYEEKRAFSLEDVCRAICEKMIRRHPHVFGDVQVHSAKDVRSNWEKIKEAEKRGKRRGLGIPKTLPALVRAYRIRARQEDAGAASSSLKEAVEMFQASVRDLDSGDLSDPVQAQKRLGHLLYRAVCLARALGRRPEDSLHGYLDALESSVAPNDDQA
ncbi:tetrapyrrole methylase family protein / MazG family protein [Desulfacinum hydrothermale DSM 13146]|uniref:Tetrapyrrole methylase family protein / MazG family protein n=2 Tax=Desulfacinum hydrothermale TaxID=109258 RepID=A0A1W1X1V4_9BACT|nr:tetrapyrrole methylase family protein / MazG family protein [Desulfacinum hydrothermale DSM 13146]